MLFRTHRICWDRVASLLSIAFTQWTKSCSMQLASPKLPKDFDVGNPGQGRFLFMVGFEIGVMIWCKGGSGVSVNCIMERKIKKKERGSVQIKLRKSEQKGKIKGNLRIRRDKETRLVVGTLALGNDPIEVKLASVKTSCRILQENQRK